MPAVVMANPSHIEILQRGLAAWNIWRYEKWQIKPDLSGVNLSRYNFRDMRLMHVDFRGSNLSHASFVQADCSSANFEGADLTGAVFSVANLCGASLADSNMQLAHFTSTLLIATDLSGAKGLETCTHFTPSFVDHTTIVKSGMLPLDFLRGCGLPEGIIEYFPSLLDNPIETYSCFISYSNKDYIFAQRLYADLQDNGIRCWFGPENLKIGDKIRDRIHESIRRSDKLLVVLSENSIDSDWVEQEVESALEKERRLKRTVLFPIRLDSCVLESRKGWAADIRRTRIIGDFVEWKSSDCYRKALSKLLGDLSATGHFRPKVVVKSVNSRSV
jgi:uncharacterized protein YjbI with pentapeptide repeats